MPNGQDRCQRRRGDRRPLRRRDPDGRRIRPVRHPREPDRGHPAQGNEGPDHHLEQLRHRRQGSGDPARERPSEEDDLQLRGREQDVRAPVFGEEAGGRAEPAGDAGRTDPRRRRGHPGVLHRDRLRHSRRRGQGDAGVRRPQVRSGARAARRLLDRQGVEGRPLRQPRLPEDDAQLQPDDGRGGQDHHRRGGDPGGARRAGARPGVYVQRVLKGAKFEKPIEQRTVRKRSA